MGFWTDSSFEPKQNFKFLISLAFKDEAAWLDFYETNQTLLEKGEIPEDKIFSRNLEFPYFFVTKIEKPNFNINSKDYKYINRLHTYPGNVTWQPISFSFIDDKRSSSISFFKSYFINKGLDYTKSSPDLSTIVKGTTNDEFLSLKIHQINSEGERIESWELYKPQVLSYSSSPLSYSEDSITEYTVSIKYDWAKLETDESTQNLLNQVIEKSKALSERPILGKIFPLGVSEINGVPQQRGEFYSGPWNENDDPLVPED